MSFIAPFISLFLTLFWIALVLGIVYLSWKYTKPGVTLLAIDANQGAIVEIKNTGSSELRYDLLDIAVTLPFISTGGAERLFNVCMKPGEARVITIRFSRTIPEFVGVSKYFTIAVTGYTGPGWFKIKAKQLSWFKEITATAPISVVTPQAGVAATACVPPQNFPPAYAANAVAQKC